ncbi:MAG TPA: alpha/beta hydrolase [Rhodocyclaceae bacterium]|nr:alpha/beta hydrolase [Rhodocyclaceae bacterium]
MKPSTSEFVELRSLRIHVRTWGPADAPQLFMLHGWMDASASFQFIVDALARDWRVIAPDWRGFGLSQWKNDSYWFADYVADLEALLMHYSPDAPARIVGHSLGGNAACLFAGIRPARIAGLVALEGFGLRKSDPADAPDYYAKWLDQLHAGPAFKRYADRAALAARFRQMNPRLTPVRADFLAEHLGQATADNAITLAADPHHKLSTPILYRLEDAKACWRRVTAPVLWVAARDSIFVKTFQDEAGQADYQARIACFRNIRPVMLEEAGHNMHHDQPEQLAQLIEEFFA